VRVTGSRPVCKSGISLNYLIFKDHAAIELYIDCDQDAQGTRNKQILDALHGQRTEIEQEYGEPLEWQRLDGKRASRIRCTIPGGSLTTPETWGTLQDKMISAMIRFEKAVVPRLKLVV
jgi:hypothetical protein